LRPYMAALSAPQNCGAGKGGRFRQNLNETGERGRTE
jgi:hypothetical protein